MIHDTHPDLKTLLVPAVVYVNRRFMGILVQTSISYNSYFYGRIQNNIHTVYLKLFFTGLLAKARWNLQVAIRHFKHQLYGSIKLLNMFFGEGPTLKS